MMADYYNMVRANITSHGRHVQAVFPTAEQPGLPFVYTIGNHEHDLPELLLIGGCQPMFGALLNNLSEQMIKRGRAFDDGEIVWWQPKDEEGQLGMKVIRASPAVKGEYTILAGQYYGGDGYAVMQVVVPGTNGKFPGEDGADDTWGQVPTYGMN